MLQDRHEASLLSPPTTFPSDEVFWDTRSLIITCLGEVLCTLSCFRRAEGHELGKFSTLHL